ncbi:hypothetical protein QYS49_22015 [Marivirga salinae]|uniref:TonB-dependent receptor n=1 Tax=Marivirga salinarum TaxID=3059078 RepID=A0AA49J8G6_9BACT|nr:hypothetical protein [Marivirga sp. BDSF4-3]WKK74411.2 hypothetical protein QYS49_22015 [Marivirga sp. BDSF4-3]
MTLQKINMLKYILFIIFFFPLTAIGQDNWDQEGDLKDSQVIIEKNRKIDLPRINRDFKKVPEIKNNQSALDVEFNSRQFIPNLNSLAPRIRVLTIQDEKLEKLYANQVKIGGGNYGALYLEGNFASKRSKDKSFGLNVFHQSFANGAIDKGNSGSGYQRVNPYGKMIFQKAVLDAEAFYERHNNFLYGYDTALYSEVDRDSLQRTFHTIGASVSLKDQNETSRYHYNLETDIYQLFTNINNKEFSFDYDIENEFDINDDFAIYLNSDGYISNLKFDELDSAQNRNLLRFKPGVKFTRENLRIGLGFNMVHENDTLEGMNKFHVFPDLNIIYTPFDKLSVFGGLKGDVRANRYRDLLMENPYLDNTVNIYNTLMPFQFYGGLRGSVNNFLGYEAGFSLSSVRNNFGYEAVYNENQGEIRYRTKYFNQNNTEANVYASISTNINKLKLNLRGDYYYYNVGETQLMPFRPNFRLKFNTDYWVVDKLKIGLNAHLQGSMNNANTFVQENANYSFNIDESIPPIYDLGIKLGYQLSNRSQVFLHANNLIANKYEYYLGYPNRGFQILGGFTYSF